MQLVRSWFTDWSVCVIVCCCGVPVMSKVCVCSGHPLVDVQVMVAVDGMDPPGSVISMVEMNGF